MFFSKDIGFLGVSSSKRRAVSGPDKFQLKPLQLSSPVPRFISPAEMRLDGNHGCHSADLILTFRETNIACRSQSLRYGIGPETGTIIEPLPKIQRRLCRVENSGARTVGKSRRPAQHLAATPANKQQIKLKKPP
jgi:hypothetical protein